MNIRYSDTTFERMGDIKGFLEVKRQSAPYRPVGERIRDYREVIIPPQETHSQQQARRCMDCGTPFCHWACPIGNVIPEWNDFLFRGHWKKAWDLLSSANNLPEFTGRLCPAICEFACVLGINPLPDKTPQVSDDCLRQPVWGGVNDDAVTIRENELAIAEYAFKKGLIKPRPPRRWTGKRIAVIGSGPAGLSCADQLNKSGHHVVLFEKDDKIGGILRYGIPDFKLEKWIIDRRLEILKKEGIEFVTKLNVGVDLKVAKLKKEFEAICLAGGCRLSRDLKIKGRDLKGIHFAMDYLTQSNRRVSGDPAPGRSGWIEAKDKRVVVIGGGDTGADCVGVAHRQGARSVVQLEILPKPPESRTQDYPWPKYPLILKTSTSHEEGGERLWSVLTREFIGVNGKVKRLSCVKVDSSGKEVSGSEFEIDADLVILAMGFVHPQQSVLLEELGVAFDERGNVRTNEDYMTVQKGIFSCGDMRRGQSLIVWAIYEGRSCAASMDRYLCKNP